MTLNDWFNKGVTAQDYIEAMEENKEILLSIYHNYQVSVDAHKRLLPLADKGIKAIVLTADWCGDAMVNVPIFQRLAQNVLMDVRFLIRDENLELMDQYLTNGRARSIPVIVFFDREGNELGKWGPRAKAVEAIVAEWKKELPESGTDEYKQAFTKTFIPRMHQLFKKKDTWNIIEEDMLETMTNINN
ncbi:thioredoxin family protein [Bacillus sp. JCM 19041]|uniref:thioredoxin family protein n=1 Tax=Bacillus sp. JCM 19041 TaxID=1460637 RepID=UPI0006D1CA6D